MIDLVLQFGYVGLFIVSYLSATLLPLASEVVVVAMPKMGYENWLVVLFATAGSFLGSLTNYYVGRKGSDFILSRYFEISQPTWQRAERFYEKWGPIALFFSWLPFIGDPLTAVAGAFDIELSVFTFWVLLGKTLRYVGLLFLSDQIFRLF